MKGREGMKGKERGRNEGERVLERKGTECISDREKRRGKKEKGMSYISITHTIARYIGIESPWKHNTCIVLKRHPF